MQAVYEIRDGSLVVLDLPLPRTVRKIGLSQRAGGLPSPGAAALIEEIKAVVAKVARHPGR